MDSAAGLVMVGVGFTRIVTVFVFSSWQGNDVTTSLYQVVWLVGPGWYVSEFAPGISLKPAVALVVLICHW